MSSVRRRGRVGGRRQLKGQMRRGAVLHSREGNARQLEGRGRVGSLGWGASRESGSDGRFERLLLGRVPARVQRHRRQRRGRLGSARDGGLSPVGRRSRSKVWRTRSGRRWLAREHRDSNRRNARGEKGQGYRESDEGMGDTLLVEERGVNLNALPARGRGTVGGGSQLML